MTRRYFVSIGGRVIGAGLQALLVAFLARSLGVSDYGVFAITMSTCLTILSLTDLGMGTSVLRLAASPERYAILSAVALWRAAVSAIVLVGCLTLALLSEGAIQVLLVATAVYVIGESAGDVGVGVLQGELRSGTAMCLLLARRVVALAPFVTGIAQPQAQVSLLATGLFGAIAFALIVGRRRAKPMSIIAYVVSHSGIVVTSIGRNLSNADSLVVGSSAGVQIAGLYGAAARLGAPVNIAISTLVQVAIPELSSIPGDEERFRVFRKMRPFVYGFAALVASSSALSPVIVTVLFGEDFIEATPIVGGVLIGAAFSAVAQLYMSWFVAHSVPRAVSVGAIITGVGGLLLLAALAATAGVWGCAVAIVIWRASSTGVIVGAWHRSVRKFR